MKSISSYVECPYKLRLTERFNSPYLQYKLDWYKMFEIFRHHVGYY